MTATPLSVQYYALDKIENRHYQRVKVDLAGRFMLTSREEYPCRVTDMSPGGLTLISQQKGFMCEEVIIYLEEIGRLECVIVRKTDDGFAVSINTTELKRHKLAEQLTWIVNRAEMGVSDSRQNKRALPKNPHATLTLKDGHKVPVKVIDISYSGAALNTKIVPLIDDVVSLNGQLARVSRVMESGCGIEFPQNTTISVFRIAHELGAEI
jgi:PilZ domain